MLLLVLPLRQMAAVAATPPLAETQHLARKQYSGSSRANARLPEAAMQMAALVALPRRGPLLLPLEAR
jgi:hypothetical protein